MMSDPISDMLARIRNGALARHDRVEMPHSKVKHSIAQVLKSEGYIDDVRGTLATILPGANVHGRRSDEGALAY